MKSTEKPIVMALCGVPAVFAVLLPALVFPACGLESSAYLDSVEEGGGAVIQVELNNKATIALPNSVDPALFKYWSILYRIYVSGTSTSGSIQTSSTGLSQINSLLANDYSTMYPYTDTTSNSIQNTNIHSIFSNRNYYEVALEGAAISNILNGSVSGKNLVIEFPPNPGSTPTLTVANRSTGTGNTYNLLRSRGSSSGDGIHYDITNNPLPDDRYFRNSAELNASANNSKTTNDGRFQNLDVADNSSATGTRYTYVALYIIALGINTIDSSYSRISSRPTFIAILMLPEKM